jgi:GH25 family lysozyme M1 (1,4-beta-N-acetylmuramidase)
VKQLQLNLIKLGFSCGKWGADGEFGDCTEQAIEAFQRVHDLEETGIYDAATRAAMEAALDRLDEPVESPRDVKIVGGNCYVRSAPHTGGRILGVAHDGEVYSYQGQTSDEGWHLVIYKNQNGWVSGKYSKLIDGGGVTRGEKIVDLSKYQPTIDYDALIADTALIILRAGYRSKDGSIYEDQKFQLHAGELTKRGVRFGVYFYSFAGRMQDAQEEARMFWRYARDYNPLFWAVDVEQDCITNEAIKAFQHELRAMGANHVGAYVANHLYQKYDFSSIAHLYDVVWIPRYSAIRPAHPCDLWQYTSTGKVDGIDGDVDMNRITGEGHTLEWFCGGE